MPVGSCIGYPVKNIGKCKNTWINMLDNLKICVMQLAVGLVCGLSLKVKVAQVVSNSLSHSPWNSPGQNTGVGSLSLLQGIVPTQGSNPGLPHCRWILYQLSQQGSPRILEWVAYPFSSGSSQPRNWTGVSCIAGGFFTNWTIREALCLIKQLLSKIFNSRSFT